MDVDLLYARRDLVRGVASDGAMAEWARHYGPAFIVQLEQAETQRWRFQDFIARVALLDPSMGPMDIRALVADARVVLSAGSGDRERDQGDEE